MGVCLGVYVSGHVMMTSPTLSHNNLLPQNLKIFAVRSHGRAQLGPPDRSVARLERVSVVVHGGGRAVHVVFGVGQHIELTPKSYAAGGVVRWHGRIVSQARHDLLGLPGPGGSNHKARLLKLTLAVHASICNPCGIILMVVRCSWVGERARKPPLTDHIGALCTLVVTRRSAMCGEYRRHARVALCDVSSPAFLVVVTVRGALERVVPVLEVNLAVPGAVTQLLKSNLRRQMRVHSQGRLASARPAGVNLGHRRSR